MNYFGSRSVKRALLGQVPEDEPISAELFSVERLEHFAEVLATEQEVAAAPSAGSALHRRLKDNAEVLNEAYQGLISGEDNAPAVTPAAAWLVDNYYVVDEHIRAIRRDLSPEFYRQLPKLARGALRGYPRVYGLAWALVAHTDSRFELDTLYRFCRAYQRVQPLTIGELWAVAITLRVVLIENLRRLASGIVSRRAMRAKADALANQLLEGAATGTPAQHPASLRSLETRALPNAFAAQLFQRLRDQDPASTPALPWLHRQLAVRGTNADDLVHAEHQRQGAVNVSVRNVITSLRLISTVDWAKFVEGVSLVDEMLRAESNFAAIDFAGRDLYRHAIEDLARGSQHTELDVTRRALDAARAALAPADAPASEPQSREIEPGFYLVSEGRPRLERELGYRVPWKRRPGRWLQTAGIAGYAGGIVASSAAITAVFVLYVGLPTTTGAAIGMTLLALILASEVAVAAVNLMVTHLRDATILPGLELADGVPAELRTVVAVPTLLTGIADVEQQLRSLEVHHLASQDGDLRFALLTDFIDAPAETMPEDDALLTAVLGGVARLNELHGPIDGENRFLVLHRRRLWNERQHCWMGWERKRGKLHEFNRLLQGASDTSFTGADGGTPRVPRGVRYVISLDADTRLPRGAALKLIGKMAHPLNRPRIDAAHRRVTAGYAILQPRVTPALPVGREASLFQGIFSGPSGIDPYAFAVSDVYQDLFGEGSYSGKGIYDVVAFEAALDERVDDNRLLSHDLFEGIHARCGLASDVEVVEEYPSRYDVATARDHRWTRGDWQLLPWIFGRSGIPALGRWKMLDNLRRSLVAPAALLLLALGWLGPQAAPWSLYVIACFALPVLLPLALGLLPRGAPLSARRYFTSIRRDVAQSLSLIALRLVFLADRAWVQSDAALRTLLRLGLTRRDLLEWTTAAQSKVGLSYSLSGFYGRMLGGLLLALAAAALGWSSGRPSWIAAPFVLAWLIAPLVAQRVSRPAPDSAAEPLTLGDRAALRGMARETWSYFDTFVTERQQNLPPDNFQEVPNPVVANRTSPTNIGLYLLSVVCAREFGWIGTADALGRLEATFASLDKLERFRGHFYNWYDTHDLRALDPRYISTVDSGNLAAHLITLEGALREWAETPALGANWQGGIEDTLERIQATAHALDDGRRNYGVAPRHLDAAFAGLRTALREGSGGHGAFEHFAALAAQAENIRDIALALTEERGEGRNAPLLKWADTLCATVKSQAQDAAAPATAERLSALAARARDLALAMEFGFLVDPERELLSIGYRVADRTRDSGCYDLLASEARLASFFAIAKGDLPVKHWFLLGRQLTPVDRGSCLVSWSGSMFEYLMPVLVMREPPGSLLGETSRLTVRRQIEYGAERNLPWGVSESAFNARDLEFTYQYSSFGVPGLGLQRGLSDEAVVAPYATALAAMMDPKAALGNFDRLAALGARGRYGWYEALDFTPARLPEGKQVVPVRAFMAHHQGMTLVSIANVLLDGLIRLRFHSHPMIEATELLLQEKTPRETEAAPRTTGELLSAPELRDLTPAVPRRFSSAHHVQPRTHLLSNGNYSVMITAAGSGYSRWRDLAVTRWREDPTRDHWGSYVFLRDVASGQVWSAGYQPVGREPDSYNVAYHEDRAEITRQDGKIVTSLEIVVSSEDDAEVRRVSVTNLGTRVREIELTTYAEVVLAAPAADSAHQAFAKLFVQTEFVADGGVLLATRRTREPGEAHVWLAHVSALDGEAIGGVQFETDRARFLGRCRELRDAVSIIDARPLSNTAGTVLDPVLALRRRVRVAPGETARIAFWTIIAASREQAIALADKHRDTAVFERAKTLAWTQAQVQLRYLGVDFDEAQDFQRIANRVLYADPALRASRDILARNQSGAAGLWPYGVSGDLPIVLVRIDDEHDLEFVKQLLRAHEYWRTKRLAVDLVILNERPPSYASDLQQALDAAIRTSQARPDPSPTDDGHGRGSVFVLRSDLMTESSIELLQTAARVVLVARRGTLAEQLARLPEPEPLPRPRIGDAAGSIRAGTVRAVPALEFYNGLGGFAAGGREYITVLDEGQWTPAPWVNVIANPQFGFLVSADGAGSAWSINARENQVTPWANDPVADPPSEVIYLRDDESGDLWSATPLPIREHTAPYVIRHGFGHTRFEHTSHDISMELVQFVPLEDPVKISRLKIINRGPKSRQLSITHYADWVLGNQASKTAAFLITEIEPRTGALLVRNPWNAAFQTRVAFMDMAGRQQTLTGDRAEFIGRHGSLSEPAALLTLRPLSMRVGAGLDPCGAAQTRITLRPGEEARFDFLLGEEASQDAAAALIERYRGLDLDAVLKSVTDYWDDALGAIQVKTPDRSMDVMLNGWLLYQTHACRLWARSGFYQSSGAYGYRDQLQDVMALCVSRPLLAREHILRAAARQFEAGDVQHWWLPSTGQGVRTRVSDDRVWLPFVIAHYLEVTEDFGVLNEPLPFLIEAQLSADQIEIFSAPGITAETQPLYEHCRLALDGALAIGSHGLPLFGTGDWNDGMNRVGAAGRGESVWLGWFLHATLMAFAPVAERCGDAASAGRWRKHAHAVQQSIEREAWDGDWYRRGYFDDGTALGSVSSDECRIDSIAQSWGVISGAAEPSRAARAMSAVNAQLVSRSDGLVQLFTPAFDRTSHDPGYIKAYPPGIRENGGQYTHGGLWSVLAYAMLGDGDMAAELFSLINPINHASTRAGIHRYKVEPYVACADIYSAPPHVGRGGWTWYTGSAGWMYRIAMESILGIRLRGRVLAVDPCIPRGWSGFSATFKRGSARYSINVENPRGVNRGIAKLYLDDAEIAAPCAIPLAEDGREHRVRIVLG